MLALGSSLSITECWSKPRRWFRLGNSEQQVIVKIHLNQKSKRIYLALSDTFQREAGYSWLEVDLWTGHGFIGI